MQGWNFGHPGTDGLADSRARGESPERQLVNRIGKAVIRGN
jgi:hypothetical protein